MPDPRFFKRSDPFTLDALASLVGGTLSEGSDPKLVITDVAPLDQAGAGQISFLDNIRYKEAFRQTKAAACIVAPEMVAEAPAGVSLLVIKGPYKAYALIAQAFYPSVKPASHHAASAIIHASATVGTDCTIEDGVVIGPHAVIGKGCWIEANAVIGEAVTMGESCRIGTGASVSHTMMGDAVRLYPGCRVGQDGFGFAIDPTGHVKVPQLGRVVIEDHVEIGANTTIDRGAGPDTFIGQGAWIDNLVQIGHNVRIGKGCVIVSQVGISGSTVVEDYAILAGQVGVAGHLRIGKGARIAAKSGIMRDVPAGEEQMGYPALPIKQFMRQIATLNRLTKKSK